MNITDILPIFVQYSPPVAIVVIIVLYILNGKLIPRATVETIMADRDMWRENFLEMLEVTKTQQKANTKLIQQAETTTKLISSLPDPEELKAQEEDDV